MKVKQVKQISAKYEIYLEEDETFPFEIVFDREEWVLQGETPIEGIGIRYSQAELTEILKILKQMNTKK